ncbi:MAG: hypothetical protein ACLTZM_06380 [Ruminococcus sp.]
MGGPDFVMCPLVDENIEPIDCIENSDAVDGIIKRRQFLKDLRKSLIGKKYVKNANGMDID